MPFRPRLLTDVPSGTPDVEIFFNGQLFLRSEDGATCEVGVNQLATNHVLTIEARTKVAGRPDLIRMRHVGPLNFRQREGMLIEVLDPVASPAAWNCRTFDQIHYDTGANPPPDDDFRWILNLEGLLFHRKDLNPTIFNSHHLIRLRGGEYFFRTAMRASGRFDFVRKDPGGGETRFKRIGAVAKASVFLDTGQSVVLRWQSPLKDGGHTVTLAKGDHTTHEIHINNAPLFIDDPEDNDPFLAQFDELIEYYKVIPRSEVPLNERFKLVPAIPHTPTSVEGGTPDIPCQVIRLDGTSDS
jgi:hypothetical protein